MREKLENPNWCAKHSMFKSERGCFGCLLEADKALEKKSKERKRFVPPEIGRAAALWNVLTGRQRYLVLRLLTVAKAPALNLSSKIVLDRTASGRLVSWNVPRDFFALPRWIKRSLKRMFMTQERTISVRTYLRKRGETEIAI